ncbi:MAG: inosine-5'-monophosphate dehydrogenase [Actinobacteria bacterium]|nr:inosine-5'-monophosphate dehydrogenase [Actinomycetota bacterium]
MSAGGENIASETLKEGLTFDDVLLLPGESKVLPKDVDVSVSLTPEIRLNIPLLTAAMDTVTEADTAIAVAREGGIGIIHRNNTADEQAAEIDQVKKSESGMIIDPITVDPDQKVYEALDVMKKYRTTASWSAFSPTATCDSRRTSSSRSRK